MQKKSNKDTLTTIVERKNVRHYTGEQVPEADIIKLLRAAMAAPATVDVILWEFIVITDKAKLEALSARLPFAQMLTDAGTGILVCVVLDEAALSSDFFAILDGGCASENILLAAEALGLGAAWTAVYPDKRLMDFVRKKLGIPENVTPLNLILVGYPNGDEKGRDKFDLKNIHWENW